MVVLVLAAILPAILGFLLGQLCPEPIPTTAFVVSIVVLALGLFGIFAVLAEANTPGSKSGALGVFALAAGAFLIGASLLLGVMFGTFDW